ncbi:putative cell wall protein-like [Capsicum annuum]|nr:putative cell wall protein-like [Capsicum annuum]
MEVKSKDEQNLEEIMISRENSTQSSLMHDFAPIDFDYPMQKFKVGYVNAGISKCSSILKRKKCNEDLNNASKIQKSTTFSLSDNGNKVEEESVSISKSKPQAAAPAPKSSKKVEKKKARKTLMMKGCEEDDERGAEVAEKTMKGAGGEDREAKTSQENEKKEPNKNYTEVERKIKNSLLSILLDKDRFFNAAIVLGAGTLAITKLLTIDHEFWHGWTLYEILRYAPEHNWIAYEEALKANPVLAKMAISGIVYSVGDWIAQCYEGKPLLEFDRTRMFRSGLVGFSLHGSLSHYYYQFCEVMLLAHILIDQLYLLTYLMKAKRFDSNLQALFPSNDWWVVPAKVAFDQTIWSAIWNSIYFVVLGLLRFESAATIFGELKTTFWPMLTAGWKLWPFAHLITYGVIPLEQRLLWVDCVELVWVTILSTYSNEKSEARISEESEAKSD